MTQLNTTLDVDCYRWMDWFHGGLQFQVEETAEIVWERLRKSYHYRLPPRRIGCFLHVFRVGGPNVRFIELFSPFLFFSSFSFCISFLRGYILFGADLDANLY